MTFQQIYAQKLADPETIATLISPGWRGFLDAPLGQPYQLIQRIEQRAKEGKLQDLTLNTLLDVYPYECYQKSCASSIHGISWFSGVSARKGIAQGYGDIAPCNYHEVPDLIDQYEQIDFWCTRVSPMDENGYFSTCNGSLGEILKKKASHLFLEVNHNLPRPCGTPKIHISEVTALYESNDSIPIMKRGKMDDTSTTIGNLIAEEIPDGATIQFGIGAIPDAVGSALMNKKHLGIHSELLTDSMIDLIEAGVVDNSRKPLNTGKTIATFMMGSAHMYDFVSDNPDILLLPVTQVNDPYIIAQHPNMISVNAALEVDFYGQVCAESIGTIHISGSGGQVDFVKGATTSKGGKSFIAFHSTAQNGTVSRIRPTLTDGSIVTTGKNDVDYIVTEYGIAKLRGKTIRQRIQALISIAHPKFREELIYEARKRLLM